MLEISREDADDLERLKKAYRAALLRTHPDKAGENQKTAGLPSVELVMKAYETLANPDKKNAYDRVINGTASVSGPLSVSEIVDLDDLELHEEDEDNLEWTKSCRCGEDKGYIVTEKDLLANGTAEEIYIQCLGCSIWIKILYSSVE